MFVVVNASKNLAEKRSRKMKKVMLLAFVMLFSVFAGCSLFIPSNQTKFEYKADPSTVSLVKTGVSKKHTILGLFTMGDASISRAAKSAGIKKIAIVESDTSRILGIIVITKTTKVTGE